MSAECLYSIYLLFSTFHNSALLSIYLFSQNHILNNLYLFIQVINSPIQPMNLSSHSMIYSLIISSTYQQKTNPIKCILSFVRSNYQN